MTENILTFVSQAVSFITAGTISAADVLNIIGWASFALLSKI